MRGRAERGGGTAGTTRRCAAKTGSTSTSTNSEVRAISVLAHGPMVRKWGDLVVVTEVDLGKGATSRGVGDDTIRVKVPIKLALSSAAVYTEE